MPHTPNVKREIDRLRRRCKALQTDLTSSDQFLLNFTQIAEQKPTIHDRIQLTEFTKAIHSRIDSIEKVSAQMAKEVSEAETVLEQVIDVSKEYEAADDLVLEAESQLCKLKAFFEYLPPLTTLADTQPSHPSMPTDQQTQMNRLLTLLEGQASNNASQQRCSGQINLPKIDLGKFDGDIFKWKGFFDLFESAIDANQALSNVQKLQYLKSSVEGEPARMIANINLSNENYVVALDLLKLHFADRAKVLTKARARLLHLEPAAYDTAGLRKFKIDVETTVRSLEALGEQIDCTHYVEIILSKLPRQILVNLQLAKGDDPWTLPLLRKLLHAAVEAEDTADTFLSTRFNAKRSDEDRATADSLFAQQNRGSQPQKSANDDQRRNFHSNPNQSANLNWRTRNQQSGIGQQFLPSASSNQMQPRSSCVFCGQLHWNSDCRIYATYKDRIDRIPGRCYACFREGHNAHNCLRRKPCRACGNDYHNFALCGRQFPVQTQRLGSRSGAHLIATDDKEESNTGKLTCEANLMTSAITETELQTAKIEVDGPSTTQNVRAVLDTASSRSYITEELAGKLGVSMQTGPTLAINRFAGEEPVQIKTMSSTVKLRSIDGTYLHIPVCIVPKITNSITRIPLVNANAVTAAANGKPLADSLATSTQKTPLDLLIGNDYYCDVVTGHRIKVNDGLYLLESIFGLILTGRTTHLNCKSQTSTLLCFDNQLPTSLALATLDIEPSIESLWNLETLGIKDDPHSTADDEAESNFLNTYTFQNNRYAVTWPYKDNVDNLPTNFYLAKSRFQTLLEKFKRDPQLLEDYEKLIRNKERIGVIERVGSASSSSKTHYLPHHAVLKPESTTTPVRIVFDASARSSRNSPSLNSCLHRGPVRIKNLVGLLMRFRLHPIAIIADIEKAFWQVQLQNMDRDVTRFLWLKDSGNLSMDDNLVIYRFCVVPFGFISSPFLLNETLQIHTHKYNTMNAKLFRDSLYVDNVITGFSNVQAATAFYKETKEIMKDASMNLREWASNNSDVMQTIPETDRMKKNELKVLGLSWDRKSDILRLPEIKISKQKNVTKKSILSLFARTYDPLGLATPITIGARMLFQETCMEGLQWNQPVPTNIEKAFHELCIGLKGIPKVSIPRFVGDLADISYLHCFCDASDKAYATAIYLTTKSQNGVATHLIYSKCRVKPVKAISLPRMELMGTLIGVRATKFVKEQISINGPSFLWCDSQIVLYWIKSAKVNDTFVENRLKEIRAASDLQFRYIGSKENPADLATKSQGLGTHQRSTLWWHGPSWINLPPESWPTWSSTKKDPDAEFNNSDHGCKIPQLLCPAEFNQIKTINQIPPFGIDIQRFSTYTRLLRVTARCNIFIESLKDKRHTTTVQAKDMQTATTMWIKHVQEEQYENLLQCINQSKKHNLISQLGTQRDPKGLLRCYGRLGNMIADEGTKYPILLPSKHPFTSLLIKDMHERLKHAGVSQVLASLRNTFWIPKGRSRIQTVQANCKTCRKTRGPAYQQPPMPTLPSERVNATTPYSFTGLDYFGPLNVKTSDGTSKVWVCLFTCLTVRSIHLELVHDLSAQEFLLALRRFLATYGPIKSIVCDNAPNFKAVAGVCDNIWSQIIHSEAVQDFAANSNIKWSYITPHAPWMGGVYERMVKSVKEVLRKVLGKSKLSTTQLNTFLKESQQIVNERPLTYVGKEIDDVTVLRPIDLIMPHCPRGGPWGSCIDDNDDDDYSPEETTRDQLVSLWKSGNNMLHQFWKIWRDQYLLSLRQKQSWTHRGPRSTATDKPQVGDVVLIKEDMQTRSKWKMARIVSLTQSDQARTATVKLPDGHELLRPVSLLYPIETGSEKIHDSMKTNARTEDIANKGETAIQHTQASHTSPASGTKRKAFKHAQIKIRQQCNTSQIL